MEVEKGDYLERCMLKEHGTAALRAEDLGVHEASCRLRTTSDWVVVESSADRPPRGQEVYTYAPAVCSGSILLASYKSASPSTSWRKA